MMRYSCVKRKRLGGRAHIIHDNNLDLTEPKYLSVLGSTNHTSPAEVLNIILQNVDLNIMERRNKVISSQ